MPRATWGSTKQAACGGDHFDGMEWREREWRAARGFSGKRDFRERVDVGGLQWSYPQGIAREDMGQRATAAVPHAGSFPALGLFGCCWFLDVL